MRNAIPLMCASQLAEGSAQIRAIRRESRRRDASAIATCFGDVTLSVRPEQRPHSSADWIASPASLRLAQSHAYKLIGAGEMRNWFALMLLRKNTVCYDNLHVCSVWDSSALHMYMYMFMYSVHVHVQSSTLFMYMYMQKPKLDFILNSKYNYNHKVGRGVLNGCCFFLLFFNNANCQLAAKPFFSIFWILASGPLSSYSNFAYMHL